MGAEAAKPLFRAEAKRLNQPVRNKFADWAPD